MRANTTTIEINKDEADLLLVALVALSASFEKDGQLNLAAKTREIEKKIVSAK